MRESKGSKGIALIECINPRLQKYRVRWNVQDVTPTEENMSSEMVSFMEEEFPFKPDAVAVEKAISESGTDATQEELKTIGSLLGYNEEAFLKMWDEAKAARVASNPYAQLLEIIKEQHTAKTDISDAEALSYPSTFLTFEELVKRGKEVAKGVVFRHKNRMWRTLNAVTPQSIYPPSDSTASLYVKINVSHKGTVDNPIPYEQMMILEKGKYYEQYGDVYECIQGTNVGFPFDLKDMPSQAKPVNK